MKKKIVVIALVAIAGASLAYFTDTDDATNVFTSGKVDITLNEVFDEENAQLIPGVDIQKDVTISLSEDSVESYVWYTYAIPAVLDDANNQAFNNIIHVNHAGRNWLGYQNNQKYWADGQTTATPEDQCWKVDAFVTKGVEIDGVIYNVYTHLYNGVLAPEATTTTCLSNVYLDPHVDIDPAGNLFWVEKGVATAIDWNIKDDGAPNVYVSAYAIQEEGFATVEEAYAAYADQWGDNGFEYGATTYGATEQA